MLADELRLLERLATLLDEYPGTDEDRAAVRQAGEQLTALFLLVIVGEFNAGKSAFINALVGAEVMPEGVTPTTAVINLLRYGETRGETVLPDGVIERFHPADFLGEITVVDTPGTNAIIREHEALTQEFVPRADLVLFVTSADRPFTESERGFMAEIREWGKKVVVILNKVDLLRDEASLNEVLVFVRESIERLVGFTPEIFPVSALLAQQAKALGDRNPEERARLWERSRFGALERYVVDTLDEEGRIRLKLLNPLGVAERLAERYAAATHDRLTVLRDDVAAIENIEAQLVAYQEDMRRQFAYHLTRIENIIGRMISRGDQFFEETIRIGRIFDLINTDKIRGEFEREVVGDTERRIDASIDELIDWMVEQDLRTWQAVNEYVDRRRLSKYEDELIGEVGGSFRYDRRNLLESVSRRAQEEVDRYDPETEAHQLSLSVRNAVAATAMAEAGAVGLGALVVAAASTVAVDITGILAASVIAGIGLFVLPARRRQARRDFHERAGELERRLIEVMREQFEHELARSVERIREAIAPYTRFVRTEQEKLSRIGGDLGSLQNDLRALRLRVGDDPALPRPTVPPATAAASVPTAAPPANGVGPARNGKPTRADEI
ncbi:MAG: dynamin family protein [Chloroflexota bacterium]|nr:dynamin family protein [Chloroflexota bacterium]